MSTWPEEHIQLLRDLWASGHSNACIADEINRVFGSAYSRMSIIGKSHRLGLPPREVKTSMDGRLYNLRGRAIRGDGVVFKRTMPLVKAAPTVIDMRPVRHVAVDPVNVSLLDLKRNQCRYATTGELPHLFCGLPTKESSSYCAVHHGLVYVPTRARTNRTVFVQRGWRAA